MVSIQYPSTRLRRKRNAKWSRDLFAENSLQPFNLIQPYFLTEGLGVKEPITTMPGIFRLSLDNVIKEVVNAANLGIKAIMLFPQIDKAKKSHDAKEAYNHDNLMCRAIKELKRQNIGIGIIADVALDPYTLNGHDGITDKAGAVLNDQTVSVLCKQALVLAKAGCDVIAPSDMMDGRVGKIRESLEQEGFPDTQIVSYAAKYASNFYGPFRDAVGSKSQLGKLDKKSYQMDIRNSQEAVIQAGLDISQGADAIIIKPGIHYLDIIKLIKLEYNIPIIAYQVSGEYAMLKIAGEQGVFCGDEAMIESLVSFKRAGASAIVTYAATEIASLLR
ncbi:porphobilinogen synthase [Candidatus Bandiella euplotis]|nr:porphobilinogen synthase [Candidatus Bandiella woodruffii]